mmetsp:Transcript_87720/g.145818  ORF Transcript_87720/g.145818 Transcript_87720/m.145818 type:complete len:210 (-) Transcript_87720:46-675(-)
MQKHGTGGLRKAALSDVGHDVELVLEHLPRVEGLPRGRGGRDLHVLHGLLELRRALHEPVLGQLDEPQEDGPHHPRPEHGIAPAPHRQHRPGHAAGGDAVEPVVPAAVVHQEALDAREGEAPDPEIAADSGAALLDEVHAVAQDGAHAHRPGGRPAALTEVPDGPAAHAHREGAPAVVDDAVGAGLAALDEGVLRDGLVEVRFQRHEER